MYLVKPTLWQMNKLDWRLILLPGLFCILFLNLFEPFGLHNANGSFRSVLIFSGYGIMSSLVILIGELIKKKVILPGLKFNNFTVAGNLIWYGLTLMIISIAIWMYFCFWFNDKVLDLAYYPSFLYKTCLVASIPITVLVYKSRSDLMNVIDKLKGREVAVKTQVQISSEYKNQGMELMPDNLIMLESSDNYVTVHYLDEGELKKKLVRTTLKSVNYNLAHQSFVQCHQSYIVNCKHAQLFRNGTGYKLEIEHLNVTLPVSRGRLSEVRDKFRDDN